MTDDRAPLEKGRIVSRTRLWYPEREGFRQATAASQQ